jgi:hypothetical protein
MNDGHFLPGMQYETAELIDDQVTQTDVILKDHIIFIYVRYKTLDKFAYFSTKFEGKLLTPTSISICRHVK